MFADRISRPFTFDGAERSAPGLERGDLSTRFSANVEHDDISLTAGDSTDIAMTRLSSLGSSSNSQRSTKDSLLSPSVRETAPRDSSSISSSTPNSDDTGNLATPIPISTEKCGWIQTAIVLQSEQLSIGILNLAYAYAIWGLWAATILIIAVHVINYLGCKIMWKYVLEQRTLGEDAQDMHTFAKLLFSAKNKGNKVMRLFVGRAFDANAIAVMAFHVLSTQYLISHLSPDNLWSGCYNFALGLLATAICCLVSLCPLGRRATWLAGISVAGMIMGLILLLIDLDGVFPEPEALDEANGLRHADIYGGIPARSWTLYVLGFLTLSFPLSVQNTVPALVSEMQKPEDFVKSLRLSTMLSACLCLSFGTAMHFVVGYSFDSLLMLLSGNAISNAAVVAFMPSVIGLGALYAGFLVKSLIHRSNWLRKLYARLEQKAMTSTRKCTKWHKTINRFFVKFGVAFALWIAAWTLCRLVPFFELLTAFIAAIFNALFGFLLPAWVGLRLTPQDARGGRSVSRWLASFVIVLGLSIFTIGIAAGANHLMKNFAKESVSLPFSCAAPSDS